MADDENPGGSPSTQTGGIRLRASADRILTRWEERVRREIPAARDEPYFILIDTLPVVLQQLAEALMPDHPRRTATQGSTVAHEHGGERVRVTRFGLEDVIAEYKILRDVISEELEHSGKLSADERNTLHSSLDQLIIEACTAYGLVQSTFRDRLFATIAHDLRNPLNAAQLAATAIARRPDAQEVGDWAARIITSIGRVDRMVQDVLDAMRLQSGVRLPLEIGPCDLAELVQRTIDRTHINAGRFVLSARQPVWGHFAAAQMERALENLVDNALKYGDPTRPITITIEEKHGRAILTVHNDGPHIPAEQQETLFRAFQRLTDAESSGQRGWGLGLAQVRAAAESHGGSIGVDSLPDRGTTFTIDIPMDARPYQDKPTTT